MSKRGPICSNDNKTWASNIQTSARSFHRRSLSPSPFSWWHSRANAAHLTSASWWREVLVVLWSSSYVSLMKTVCLHVRIHSERRPATQAVSPSLPSVIAAVTLPPLRLCHFVFFLFWLFISSLLYFLLHPLALPLAWRRSASLTLCVFRQSDTGAQHFDPTHHGDSHNCLTRENKFHSKSRILMGWVSFLGVFFFPPGVEAHVQASTRLLSNQQTHVKS